MKEKERKTKSYTQVCKQNYILFTILSWLMCFGIAALLIIKTLASRQISPDGLTMEERFGKVLYPLAVSLLITSILAIVVKDRLEPTVWMVNIILSGYLYSMTAVYIVFVVWFIDTYVFKALKAKYKNKFTINKEIDRREKVGNRGKESTE